MDQAQNLQLLFARLGLPLPTVKWWTYCQIGSLLDDTDTAEPTWAELLGRLSFAQLESEAVELLTPLLLVKRPIGRSPDEIRSAIRQPSLLSDHIVSLINDEPVVVPAWLSAHSGHVPRGFSVTDEDRKNWSNRVREGVVPVLDRFDKRFGANLVAQFEYEMVMLSTRHKTRRGSLEYFAGGYYRNKITGPLDEQEDHLWRSAYLRAAAYGVSEMDMPHDLALSLCHDLMPLSRWLGKLRPPARGPIWLPRLEFRVEAPEEFINSFVLSFVNSVTDESKGFEILGVLDARVVSTPRIEVEILAVLVLADPQEAMDVEQFFSNPPVSVSPADSSAEEFVLVNPDDQPNQDQAFRTFTGKLSLGLDGYLQVEVLMRPPWVPILNPQKRVVCRTGERPELRFFVSETQVGRCLYWNNEWEPVHDVRVGPSACTATLFSREYVKQIALSRPAMTKIVWRATVLTRDGDYQEFSERKLFGSLPVGV